MNENIHRATAVERYTSFLKKSRKAKLPPGYPLPQPPVQWPEENIALFERYLDWLHADGAGQTCIMNYYLPGPGTFSATICSRTSNSTSTPTWNG